MNEYKQKINFTIIAHVDHGKSTLSDRILEICGAKDPSKKQEQVLDNMDLEKERGITIKAQSVRLDYKNYILTLYDTPGHADFSHEVHRSLTACETSILLVDATQGIQAQTLAHLHKAIEYGHVILPVLNKIDLPGASIEMCVSELKEIGVNTTNIQYVSAKTGKGVVEMLDTLIKIGIPCKIDTLSLPQARIIDSWYDNYSGIVLLIRLFTGIMKVGETFAAFHSQDKFVIKKLFFLRPHQESVQSIESGDIAIIITGTKEANTMPGDILYTGTGELIPELQHNIISRPIVFYTIYLEDSDMIDLAPNILKKYQLNDPAFTFTIENSLLYGICFNCGFLGMLHCQIVKERLSRQFNLEVCTTSPSVEYHVYMRNGNKMIIHNHKQMPNESEIDYIEEPYVKCNIFISNKSNIGQIMDLCVQKRALNMQHSMTDTKIIITCEMPLVEVITNFNDKLKSLTSGYASFEYELSDYKLTNLTKLIVVINGKSLDDNGMLVHDSRARHMAQLLAKYIKEESKRSQIATKIQIIASTSIDNKSKNILASADISAYRKDVTSHCSGGDISRKKKLLENQKRGKEKLSMYGNTGMSQGLTNKQWSNATTKACGDIDD